MDTLYIIMYEERTKRNKIKNYFINAALDNYFYYSVGIYKQPRAARLFGAKHYRVS